MGAHTLSRTPILSSAFRRKVRVGPAVTWAEILQDTHAAATQADLAFYDGLMSAAPPKSSPRCSRAAQAPSCRVA